MMFRLQVFFPLLHSLAPFLQIRTYHESLNIVITPKYLTHPSKDVLFFSLAIKSIDMTIPLCHTSRRKVNEGSQGKIGKFIFQIPRVRLKQKAEQVIT